MTAPLSPPLRIHRRLIARAAPYCWHLVGIFLLGLAAMPIALLTPLPVKLAVDSAIGDEPLPGLIESLVGRSASTGAILALAVGLLLAVTVLSETQKAAENLLRTYTGERMLLRFRSELFRHTQKLSFSVTDERGAADTMYRIQYDAEAVKYVTIDTVIPVITAAITAAGMIIVAASIDGELALIALAVAPPMLVTLGLFRRRLRRRARQVKRLESKAFSVVHEVLSAFRVVKAFGQEDREQHRFEDESTAGLQGRVRLVAVEGLFGVLIATITALGTGTVLFVGASHVREGVITLGDLLVVLGYLTLLYSPLQTMSRKVARLQNHLAGAERALSLLDTAPDVEERADALPLGRARGSVEFRDVGFGYRPGDPVLSGVDLAVPAGASVGIGGPTGVGKTTLMGLLTRFSDPSEGAITLDGVDLRDYRLADLRDQFAVVLQEPVLFSTSIGENIAYGRPAATADEIVAAAKAAGAHDFIEAMPDGYDTKVGERGMTLSGGERQRISVARAFLKDAPILILDEPTSSVDLLTERIMLSALRKLMAGRTTFMISHRASALARCDIVVEVAGGRLRPISEKPAMHARTGRRPRVLEHPAAEAWSHLAGRAHTPSAVERVVAPTTKSDVFRLVGSGPGETPVIAKRAETSTLVIERMVYEFVLPNLPVATADYYGSVEEDDGRCWIFLEDVGGSRFSVSNPEARVEAARWLAELHRSSADLAPARAMPTIGPDRYLGHLRGARQAITENIDNPALTSADLQLLDTVLHQLDVIEERWPIVQEKCIGLPSSLIHADFQPKNAFVRPSPATPGFVLIDWETSGWGPVAPDLSPTRGRQWAPRIDLDVYASIAGERWPELTPVAATDVMMIGGVLQHLAAIHWACAELAHAWPEKGTSTLRAYRPDTERVLAILTGGEGMDR